MWMMERSEPSGFGFKDGHGSKALVVERRAMKKNAKMVESMSLDGIIETDLFSSLYIREQLTCELAIITLSLILFFLVYWEDV